jgi:hypothetical protein
MIGFIGTVIAVTLNYNHLIGECLKLVPFLPEPRVSSTVTELVLIHHESVTSSASVVRWSTLHSWTLLRNANFCTAAFSSMNLTSDCQIALLLKVKVRVTLRLAVYRQSVRLGVKPLWDPPPEFFFQLNSCGNSLYVTSSLTRRWVCL